MELLSARATKFTNCIEKNLGLCLWTFIDQHLVSSVSFLSVSGKPVYLVGSTDDGTIKVWNIMEKICILVIEDNKSNKYTTSKLCCKFNFESEFKQTNATVLSTFTAKLFTYTICLNKYDGQNKGTKKNLQITQIPAEDYGNALFIDFINCDLALCVIIFQQTICIIDYEHGNIINTIDLNGVIGRSFR